METPTTKITTAAVFAGGMIGNTIVVEPVSLVIAADSGYDNARSLGVDVDILVGDMDSISVEGLAEAEALGTTIERSPVEKDSTDLEIAIDAALRRGAADITIYGGEGGSLGHLLGVALGLTEERWNDVSLAWSTTGATVYRALPSLPITFDTPVGSSVTILPVGDADHVTAAGLKWPLERSDLTRGTTRGISNIATASRVLVSVATGALLIIVEETESP